MRPIKITCPYCKNIIDITINSSKEQNIKCYICNETFTILQYENKKSTTTDSLKVIKSNTNNIDTNYESYQFPLLKIQPFNLYVHDMITKIIGLLFIISGSYILVTYLDQNPNVGVALIIIGISFFFLNLDIKFQQKSLIMRIIYSEKISIIFMLWIFISVLLTYDFDFGSFILSIIIGFLVIKELTRYYITDKLDKKMKIFIIAFFLIYIMIMGDKILSNVFI